MAYPLNDSDKMDEAKNNIVNILKMEGYKIDSGNLFIAFKEAGGEISNFKPALDELTHEGKIKADSDGNIMTVEDFQREKSQEGTKEGFSNINDDFNDVLLFGLLGIFFLIFTDYVYKLGRKSY